MNEDPTQPADLLAQYAQAESDQLLLRMILDTLSGSDDVTMFDGPVYRAIERAQNEAERIRMEYATRGQDE